MIDVVVGGADAAVVSQQSLIPIENVNHCFLLQRYELGHASLGQRRARDGSSHSRANAAVSEDEESSYPQQQIEQEMCTHFEHCAAFPITASQGYG